MLTYFIAASSWVFIEVITETAYPKTLVQLKRNNRPS